MTQREEYDKHGGEEEKEHLQAANYRWKTATATFLLAVFIICLSGLIKTP